MSHEFLDDRRRALEEAFFARENEALLRRLRGAEAPADLAEASGIRDPAVLDRLAAQGIGPGALAALSLAPLVLVAWADGTLEDKERAAVLSAAAEGEVALGGAALDLLAGWLATPPPPTLIESWTDYVRALAPEARAGLRGEVMGRARRVAEAAGGFLGLTSKVSAAEEAMLKRLEGAFAA